MCIVVRGPPFENKIIPCPDNDGDDDIDLIRTRPRAFRWLW